MSFKCKVCSSTTRGGDTEWCVDCKLKCTKQSLCRSCLRDKICAFCGADVLKHSGKWREIQLCEACKEGEMEKERKRHMDPAKLNPIVS